ncbi:hypothetical protein SESBI_37539 [Sesbania bispinosa]|nr:hypothetical protein SESBI_37539 [Sesbania bispinosa]
MAGVGGGVFDAVKSIHRGKETWRLKVRVVDVGDMCKGKPSNVFSVEMVLVDAKGGRFKPKTGYVEEDQGISCESEIIPRFGFDLRSSQESMKQMWALNICLKKYEKFNRTIRVLEVELTDDKGVVRCSLFGHFIDLMKDYLNNRSVDELDIVVIQFASLRSYMGKNSLHTLCNSTRVLWNPQIEEAISFKNSIAFHGFNLHAPMKVIGENERPYSLREEFLSHFTRKTVEDLQLMKENEMWWYNACKCHKAVTYDDDSENYYCAWCEANVSDVTPRFRLRLDVGDITERAEFIIFDYDASFLLSKTCASMVGDAVISLTCLLARNCCLRWRLKDRAFKWDDSFKVKKVCSDEGIIREFKEESSVKTPEKTSLTEVPGEGSAADAIADCSVVIDLGDVCTGGELTPISAGGSSNAAMCLAPQKRKGVPRGDRAALSKQKALGRPVKVEKEYGS